MNRDDYLEIRRLADEGLSMRAIARRLGVHRRKVRLALASESVPRRCSRRRGSLIDPHRGWIMARLQLYPELTAARLYAMLSERGYTGSYTLVKEAVAELRPRLMPVYNTCVFAPGECAQVDWGVWKSLDVRGGRRQLRFFTMVLCHSRMLYVEFFFGEALEFWLTAHRNAFDTLGGVPEKVMVDNCKTAVITPRSAGVEPVLNESYAAFAHHYGFTIVPCNPHRPNEKGRVERAVGYVKSAFLAGRLPSPPEAINPAARHWLAENANVRVHRTIRERPIDRFLRDEKPALRSLPPDPHPCAAPGNCVASSTCRVTVDTNRYSIDPAFASQRLLLHRYAERIVITTTDRTTVVAEHRRSFDRGREIVDPRHAEALNHLTRRASQNRQVSAMLALGVRLRLPRRAQGQARQLPPACPPDQRPGPDLRMRSGRPRLGRRARTSGICRRLRHQLAARPRTMRTDPGHAPPRHP